MLVILIIIKYQISFNYIESFSQYTWSGWSEWPLTCSSTCKVGQRCRIRNCEDSKSNVVKSYNCGKPEDVKECQKCVAKGICPIDAGWSEWFPWSECKIKGVKKCGEGTRQRIRVCNNPKPKYDGMHCIGNSTDQGDCSSSCLDPSNQAGFFKDSINEYFKDLNHNVQLVNHGEPVILDCFTPAYLKASTGNKKLFVLWSFNGIPLRPLKELILQDMKAMQGKLNKAGVKSSYQIPKGHIQYTGTKLTIDSVTTDDSGVFTCILNYDYVDYSNTFFVIIVLGRHEYAQEFDEYTFNSNTEGLQNVEYFDQAEIRWYLNRQLILFGLLSNPENRFYTIFINKTMEGHWECHLFADYHKTKHWIVNSFELKIKHPRTILNKLIEIPILYYSCYYFGLGILLTFIVFVSSFLVVKLRITNWLNYDRKEAIIEEEIENNRLLLIIARKRAMEKTIELMKNADQKLDPIYEDYEPLDDEDEDESSSN